MHYTKCAILNALYQMNYTRSIIQEALLPDALLPDALYQMHYTRCIIPDALLPDAGSES